MLKNPQKTKSTQGRFCLSTHAGGWTDFGLALRMDLVRDFAKMSQNVNTRNFVEKVG